MIRSITGFLKTTAIGGLFALLPILLLGLVIEEVAGLAVALATPIADLFPDETFERIEPPLVALVLILVTSFVLGLLMRMAVGRRVGAWLERNTFGRLPIYSVLKTLSRRLGAAEEDTSFQPVLLKSPSGWSDLAYRIEEHDDGRVTVMIPWAPAALSGQIRIVPREHVKVLDASLGEMTKVLSHWGIGTAGMVGKT